MALAYVSLGANLGDREATCLEALVRMGGFPGTRVTASSGLYETEPQGVSDQPVFLNSAAELSTGLEPHALLVELKRLEVDLGRRPSKRWGPRAVDLDLLLYDQRVVDTPDLVVPHPRMHERRFVLAPLAEIAADCRHPIIGRSIKELLDDLGAGGGWVRKTDGSVNSA